MFRKISKTNVLRRGGEKMKVFGLVLAMVVLAGGIAVADTVSYDVYAGWNLISAPLVPFNPDPASVFAGAPDGLDYRLYGNDPAAGGTVYDSLDPGAFGNVLLGDGYWLNQDSTGTISFDGVADGVPDSSSNLTDMWISLPGAGSGAGGWHLIGCPYNHDIATDDGSSTGANVLFTNGSVVKNWSDAVAASWVSDVMIGNNNPGGGFNVQYDGLGDDDSLRAGKGYWVRTYVDNIAMILKP